MDEAPPPPSGEPGDLAAEVERLRLLHAIGQEFNSSLDFDELLPKVFNTVLDALGAQGGSIWIAAGDVLTCRLALGPGSAKLVGSETPIGTGFVGDVARKQRSTIVADAMQDERFQARLDRSSTMITTTVMAAPMIAKGETVGSIQVNNKVRGLRIFDENDRLLLEGLAETAAVALRNAQLHQAEKRARNLALLLEISREITSTLDLDRVLGSVVNLATQALPFDRGAVGLYHDGRLEIRAIAGQETVDPKDDTVRRLADRGTWAVERGEPFYLADGQAPAGDDARAFASAFGEGLAADAARSGLYLPLKDEQGTLGVLLFEAERPDFLSTTQQELAGVLANQTAVAARNAELYAQVPLVDVLGKVARAKRAVFALPRRRLQVYTVVAVLALAALTLIRWPLRVVGVAPTFRALSRVVVRPMVDGSVERVLVAEGAAVQRGDPIVQLRTVELRGAAEATGAAADVAERLAAAAAARGDAATERLQRGQAASLRRELALLDEQVAAATVRSPVTGVVLTARPQELVGLRPEAGDSLLVIGRTDSLELDLGVSQRDIERVAVGQEVRLRVDALPQHTFRGRVTFLGALPLDATPDVAFAVRAIVPNPDGALRPGMVAHARVLTARASTLGRVLRGPVRWLRLLWWRMWP
jgi:GAF domain-containing protein/multidrug efflux pump subunit AcrA (membrane-fusion protein)